MTSFRNIRCALTVTGLQASTLLALLIAPFCFSQQKALVCSTCHPAQTRPQPFTGMGHALQLLSDCTILKDHPSLTFKYSKYTYKIERQGDASIYTVSDGEKSVSVPLGWAFGFGSAGQTYVYQKDGQFFQSRVSFYNEVNGLDLTLGAMNALPKDLSEAAGMPMDNIETVQCFSCHSTNAVQGRTLTLNTMHAGIECARCHGPTEHHLEGIKSGDAKAAHMEHLKSLSSEDMANFCGQCHRTWEQVIHMQVKGVVNVRFQPYRLVNSKCYDADDARISCIACHDPHVEVDRIDSHYDSKCLACHAGGKPEAKMCKVAKKDCATCHMPKIQIPGAHHAFNDHDIRIVKANAPYPN